ncbi:MAG: hypothetical protein H6747_12535 [Deltaproteobacteria bacterium]|nr:hypothetical protein [Deltaproteobacteria bacterium]
MVAEARLREGATARLHEPAWRLLVRAIGNRRAVRDKVRRVGRTLPVWADGDELGRRLDNLAARGLLDPDRPRPNRAQLFFGGLDQLRWVIIPGARDYYAQRGISFAMHQVLRFADDPVSVLDPSGLFSLRETITGHVLQVTHLDPIYDLELLQMWPDGVADFEAEVGAMIDGSHPRAGTIGAVIEDAGYHTRLLGYVRAYRADPAAERLRRDVGAVGDDPHFAAASERFATLGGYLDWCQSLPRGAGALAWRWASVRRFPLQDEAAGAG